MVVPDFHPGFKFEVVVDGEPLREYDDNNEEVKAGEVDEYEASRTVSKYIEAVTGKEFSIRLSLGKPYEMDCPTLCFETWIDGNIVFRHFLKYDFYNPEIDSCVYLIQGILIGKADEASLIPFKFNNFQITTDDAKLATVERDSKAMQGVGEISILVFRATKGQMKVKQFDIHKSLIESEVHEKVVKGKSLSHSTTFGEPRPLPKQNMWIIDLIDGEDRPIVIAKFKYRSEVYQIESLKQLRVLERTPEPEYSPSPMPEEPRSSPTFDLDNLNPSQKADLANLLSIAAGGSASSTPQPRIKHERDQDESSKKSRKKPKYKTTVTIDLTADSDEEVVID